MSENILQRIVETRHRRLQKEEPSRSVEEWQSCLEDAPAPRGFARALRQAVAAGRPAVIAELKRCSPSAGLLRQDYEPADIAGRYERAGASCLSVLTEPDFFQGDFSHLQQARAACALPVLCKDFIVSPYHIRRARLAGADCILLIIAALDDTRLLEFNELALSLGMDVLVEVHNREELTRSLLLRSELLGINNRNLRTFVTDINVTMDMVVDVPHDRLVVSESGLSTPQQTDRLRAAGVNAFLVGENLMRDPDPGAALSRLFPDLLSSATVS